MPTPRRDSRDPHRSGPHFLRHVDVRPVNRQNCRHRARPHRGAARGRPRLDHVGGRNHPRRANQRGGRLSAVGSAAGNLHGGHRCPGLPQGRQPGSAAGRRGHAHGRLRPRHPAGGRHHGDGHETRGDRLQHAGLGCGADRRDHARPGHQQPRGHRGQRGRLQRPEPGSRPEHGGDPRRVLGSDRPRPTRRQGAGGRLPGRVGHLALAVYPGHGPLRPESRRGAEGSPGNPVRLGFRGRHRPLHQQPAPAGGDRDVRRGRRRGHRRRRHGRKLQGRIQYAAG